MTRTIIFGIVFLTNVSSSVLNITYAKPATRSSRTYYLEGCTITIVFVGLGVTLALKNSTSPIPINEINERCFLVKLNDRGIITRLTYCGGSHFVIVRRIKIGNSTRGGYIVTINSVLTRRVNTKGDLQVKTILVSDAYLCNMKLDLFLITQLRTCTILVTLNTLLPEIVTILNMTCFRDVKYQGVRLFLNNVRTKYGTRCCELINDITCKDLLRSLVPLLICCCGEIGKYEVVYGGTLSP